MKRGMIFIRTNPRYYGEYSDHEASAIATQLAADVRAEFPENDVRLTFDHPYPYLDAINAIVVKAWIDAEVKQITQGGDK